MRRSVPRGKDAAADLVGGASLDERDGCDTAEPSSRARQCHAHEAEREDRRGAGQPRASSPHAVASETDGRVAPNPSVERVGTRVAAVSFDVAADAYDRFMGRYSTPLAPALADFAGVEPGQTALDVGCGPGALTAELVKRLGADAVAAVDPSPPFVEAVRSRYPGVDVRQSPAEELPYPDGGFDTALAQLVVHFMSDPVEGLGEMARVTRADGIVAACVWDLGGERAPISPFWRAARQLDPDVDDESHLAGVREGHLAELLRAAGLSDVEDGESFANLAHATFEDWWEPFALGVGPAGAYLARLAPERRDALRERCRAELPPPPFVLSTRAWVARGVVRRPTASAA